VAWNSIAFQLMDAKPRDLIVAMGDSYSSGEGAGDYYTVSDNHHATRQWDACRRSPHAWIRDTVLPGRTTSVGQQVDSYSADTELGFVACSGAVVFNVDNGNYIPGSWQADRSIWYKNNGQFREISQVDSGFLSADTTLVTLSIGGNDAGFTDVLLACGALPGSCEPDLPTFKQQADNLQPKLKALLQTIHDHAPNAQIVLMGYPNIFGTNPSCPQAGLFDTDERKDIGDLADYLDVDEWETVGQLATAEFKLYFANPLDTFKGHGGCDADPWINLFRAGQAGEGDFHKGDPQDSLCFPWGTDGNCLSRESSHPFQAGTAGYARFLEDRLVALGYDR
jgi:hypothetical protein